MTPEQQTSEANDVEQVVMPEPPFCAWCGGTCECEDFYDEDPNEDDYCNCAAIHDDEEIASNCCKCCGGIVKA